jgi:O-antigen/teichoic acid export membrane protein
MPFPAPMSNADPINQQELAGDVASPVELEFQHVSHGAERNRRLIRSVITGVLIKPLAVAISFFSVPLFLKYLGPQRYGLYEAIVALSSWLALSNAGVTYGLINKLTDCNVSGDRLLARRYVSSMFFAFAALVGAAALLVTIATPLIHWQWFFPADDAATRAQVPWVVWATAIVTFASLLMTLPACAYAAYQEYDRYNCWDGASKLATLAACFAVVRTPLGLMGVAMAILGVPIFVRGLNCVWFFTAEKPWLTPSRSLFDRTLLRATVTEGIYIFVLQAAAIIIFQSDKLIISSVLGGQAVADFAVIGRLYLLAYGVFSLLLQPLWPAYGEAARRGDLAWVRRTLRLSLVLGCGTMLACGIGMFFVGGPVLRLWTRGQQVFVSRHLVLAVTALFVSRAATECQSVVLNSIGVMVPQMLLLGANAVLNIALGLVLAHKFGVVGVAWSFPITALFTSLWGYPWLIHRHLDRRLAQPEPEPQALKEHA